MFNPEWEAIKRFEHEAACVDVQFELSAGEIAADHGLRLYEELTRLLPWLADTPDVGVHPIHGAPTGRNDNLVVNRRVKLTLRLPLQRIEAAAALVGARLDLGAGPIQLGALKKRPLMPYATQYAHLVVMDTVEEAAFLDQARAQLEQMGVQAGLIPGKRRRLRIPQGEAEGYSLMLYDLKLEDSIRVQERGLGHYRQYGCGIFIPHKSIKEVVID
ncbi:MAG: type I-MYXAN CRISPR-associated protein Cas6/Cmx6 [Burkholderiales bacterium]|nr:type I-MYXAN CRISPR-associated protein Cas6/Cmx6 [Burkholderiales bacterium]